MKAQAGFSSHVTELGQGVRRVLALHCTLAHGGAWGGVAKHLGDTATLIAPDMASHGRSADWDGTSDFAETTYQATLALLPDTPIDIIGHSFGAMTGLRIAAEHPEKVRSLVLFEPVFFAVALADAADTLASHDAAVAPFNDAIASGDMAVAARAFNGMWSDGIGGWDRLPDRTRAAMIRAIHVVPDTVRFLYDDDRNLLKDGVLAAVKAPTVVMRGALSLPAITSVNKGLAQRLGNATEAVIEGAGHMAPISHPSEFAAAVGALWDRS